MRSCSLALAVAALCLGCSPAADLVAPAPTRAALAAAKVDQLPRARLSFADSLNVGTASLPQWVPTAYRGDGRLRGGTAGGGAVSNEYQGNFCGVTANIGTGTGGQSTQFAFDPDGGWTSSLPAPCQPARFVVAYINGTAGAPGVTRQHLYFPNLGSIAVGDTMIQAWNNGTLAELGQGRWFDDAYPPAASLRLIRLTNVTDEFGRSVRQWRIESRGSHRAMGAINDPNSRKGGVIPSGITYYMPWSMTVTEVPYPYPTYP